MFDKQKYLDESLQKLTKYIESLENLRNEGDDLKQIVDQCFEWYEKDSLNLYCIFGTVCGSSRGLEFFGNLHNFLVNTLLDDSYFEIIKGKDSNPYLIWAFDEEDLDNNSQDPKKILELFFIYKEKDLERSKLEEEKVKLLEKLRSI